jgi:N-acylneuraminate cytidylyltransferase
MVEAKPEVLAIIPARGGSKGIPRKNIRKLAGYPLIAYSIAAARQAELVTRVIVSTDDAEIAAVARQFGAETPFLRPAELAQDETTDFPVFEQALTWLAEHENYHPDLVVQLRPTSPIRPSNCVDGAIRALLANPEGDSIRGVVPSGQNPHKMWRIQPDGQMSPLLHVDGIREPYNAPRQILPPVFWQTGHIDVIRTDTILKKKSMSGDVILPWKIDPVFTIDMDNLRDLERAEWIITHSNLDMVYPGRSPRPFPEHVSLVVFDFDGVMTDNRVWVDENGHELVAANRSDSLGIYYLFKKTNIELMVMSMEVNPVVAARCKKMKIPVMQAVIDKGSALKQLISERSLDPAEVIYMGNDTNDLPCFPLVGCAVVPADAEPDVLCAADLILTRKGGHGAVRELCDMLMQTASERSKQ